MSFALEVKQVTVAFGAHTVLSHITFALSPGEIGCLLGPSGCGKTSLLRAIAGFESPPVGEIWINGVLVNAGPNPVPTERRKVGMVFQDLALFPHLNIEENIAFGLRGLSRATCERRVRDLIDLVGLNGTAKHYPHVLSGGQQQRVALARAMAPRPAVLLLDEPFSSLDVELREQIAKEVRTILKQEGITAILVSHNQLETFAMADQIGVINQGRLLQWDTAYNLYHRPCCRYVADFIGEGVFLEGTVAGADEVMTELGPLRGRMTVTLPVGSPVDVLIRPDDVVHDDASPLTATVLDKVFRGAEFLYTLGLPSGTTLLALVPSHHNHALKEPIGIRLEPDHLVLFEHHAARHYRQDA
jgi:iron(III) transport system ATP-binding protein